MALYNFKNQVGNGSASFPANLGLALSASNVTIDTFGANVIALLFDDASIALTNQYAALTFGGTSFRVDRAYNGTRMALLSSNLIQGLATLFTCATGTAAQTATAGAIGVPVASPDWIRLWNLNG